jgi:hypothetical protein
MTAPDLAPEAAEVAGQPLAAGEARDKLALAVYEAMEQARGCPARGDCADCTARHGAALEAGEDYARAVAEREAGPRRQLASGAMAVLAVLDAIESASAPQPAPGPCPGCESLRRQCSELAGEVGFLAGALHDIRNANPDAPAGGYATERARVALDLLHAWPGDDCGCQCHGDAKSTIHGTCCDPGYPDVSGGGAPYPPAGLPAPGTGEGP